MDEFPNACQGPRKCLSQRVCPPARNRLSQNITPQSSMAMLPDPRLSKPLKTQSNPNLTDPAHSLFSKFPNPHRNSPHPLCLRDNGQDKNSGRTLIAQTSKCVFFPSTHTYSRGRAESRVTCENSNAGQLGSRQERPISRKIPRFLGAQSVLPAGSQATLCKAVRLHL